MTVIVTECETEPLVAVREIVYPPIGVLCAALTLSVIVLWLPGVSVIDELLGDVLGAGVGETVAERFTVPANPFRLVNVTMTVRDAPRGKLRDDGLTVIEKSETVTRTETE